MEGMIDNGNKVGIWKLFNEDGELAGYYKTYYEDETPVFKPVTPPPADTLKTDSLKAGEKPIVTLPKKKSRHFTKKLKEYQNFIVAIQPLGMMRSHLPVSLEYYFQERLGYEINYTIYRNPFFKSGASFPLNTLYKRGFSTYLRQKLYQRDDDNNMFYWAQEVRFSSIDYYINTLDSTGEILLHKKEKLYEFSVLFGDRILKDPRNKGWTMDLFGGLGVGYRSISRNYENDPKKEALFVGVKTRRLSIPIRFGVSFGYLF
jgi:hypothetical protein